MNSDTHANILDYEQTVEELRQARALLMLRIDQLVEAYDTLMNELKIVRYSDNTSRENSKYLLETIDNLRSENERLRIALQTGEQ